MLTGEMTRQILLFTRKRFVFSRFSIINFSLLLFRPLLSQREKVDADENNTTISSFMSLPIAQFFGFNWATGKSNYGGTYKVVSNPVEGGCHERSYYDDEDEDNKTIII